MQTKTCTKCGEVKPLDAFNKDKRRVGGRSRCKECEAEYARRYYAENPEKGRERHRRYREENPEKERERQLRYREENLESIQERDRRYREENREVINAKLSLHMATTQELTKALSSVHAGIPWSEEEDAFLMSDNGMTTYEKATQLGRTYGSCNNRRQTLRKKLGGVPR